MDLDGDVDGVDFLGFHYLIRHVLQPDEAEPQGDPWNAPRTEHEAHDEWDDGDEADDDHEELEIDEDDY
jgi:hypothetical protein